MLKINFEFRKGIFFIRLIGDLNKQSSLKIKESLDKLLFENDFKYIVINTNYLKNVDFDGLNYIAKICYITTNNNNNLVICDKTNILSKLLSFPSIKDESEVL